MKRLRTPLLLVVVLGLLHACAPVTRTVVLHVPAIDDAGGSARFDVPKDWVPLESSAARAEFIGPDRRSRAYLRAVPPQAKNRTCGKLVRAYADDAIDSWGGPPQTRVVQRKSSEREARFELQRTDPKPHGEVIWSRILCSDGTLAVASCTLSLSRKTQLGPTCSKVLESLAIEPAVREATR